MIIIRIQGGLGNQLFQYAAAKCLAEKTGALCKLDTSSLHQNQLRQLDLTSFSFEPIVATTKEIKQFVYLPSLYRHSPCFLSKLGKNIYRESHFHFDEKFYSLNNPVYLDGYFQSEKYFKPVENIIRTGFTVKPSLVSHLKGRIFEWQASETVAVHIRRGDYTNKKIQDYHGILTADYYNKAIALVAEKITTPYFCFFSDDIDWVKKNIIISFPHEFTSSFTNSAIEDFYLMTQCRHNIIANSSFSWWAAWLNNHSKKTIIAPKKWFNKAKIDTKDLFPHDWMQL